MVHVVVGGTHNKDPCRALFSSSACHVQGQCQAMDCTLPLEGVDSWVSGGATQVSSALATMCQFDKQCVGACLPAKSKGQKC